MAKVCLHATRRLSRFTRICWPWQIQIPCTTHMQQHATTTWDCTKRQSLQHCRHVPWRDPVYTLTNSAHPAATKKCRVHLSANPVFTDVVCFEKGMDRIHSATPPHKSLHAMLSQLNMIVRSSFLILQDPWLLCILFCRDHVAHYSCASCFM